MKLEKWLIGRRYNWLKHARPEQLPPPGDWFVWLLLTGRGFGKTRASSEFIRSRVDSGQARRVAIIGQTKADVRDTMIEVGDSALLNCYAPNDPKRPTYEPSKRRVVWPNGAIGIAYSGDEPEQLRGPQHDLAAVDELCKFKYARETMDNLFLGLRLGQHPQVVVTTTPKPIRVIRDMIKDPDTRVVRGSTFDNAANLATAALRRFERMYGGTLLGRQELHGEILDETPGALWTQALIDQHRIVAHPQLRQIVVGVDPAATSSDDADETGIVVAGLGDDGHGYVLEDITLRGAPGVWALAATEAYRRHRADCIVAESNNGGEMVGFTIATVDPAVPFKLVWASRGKRTRAEPISMLYEQGRIHHVGLFGDLEDQLCNWVPGENSPDRLDALVWAFTELFLEPEQVDDQVVTFDDRVAISPI